MKKERMTIEELVSLKPSMDNPVELECDDKFYGIEMRRIRIFSANDKFINYIKSDGKAGSSKPSILKHYPSKKVSKWETVRECQYGVNSAKKFDDGNLLDIRDGKMRRFKTQFCYPLIEGGGVWEVNLEENRIRRVEG